MFLTPAKLGFIIYDSYSCFGTVSLFSSFISIISIGSYSVPHNVHLIEM